jgi:hypothetical protein
MENKSNFSTSEIVLRGLLFYVFACSAIFKLIVGFDNFEMSLLEAGLVDNWIQSVYVTNLTVIAEISCAVFALFGKFNWFQKAVFSFTFILYLLSLVFCFGSTYYQDYTLIFFGFDIYSEKDVYFFGGYILNSALLLSSFIFFLALQRKEKTQLLKWPLQLSIIAILSFCYILFGSLNTKQFKIKTEKYSSSITNWGKFHEATLIQYPEFKKGNWTVAFFSTGCDHCKKFARKISFTPGSDKNLLYVFWSEEEDIEKFKKDNNIKCYHLKLPQHVIMNIAGQEYPVFFTFRDGKPTQSFSGSEFSYAVIDKVFGN